MDEESRRKLFKEYGLVDMTDIKTVYDDGPSRVAAGSGINAYASWGGVGAVCYDSRLYVCDDMALHCLCIDPRWLELGDMVPRAVSVPLAHLEKIAPESQKLWQERIYETLGYRLTPVAVPATPPNVLLEYVARIASGTHKWAYPAVR